MSRAGKVSAPPRSQLQGFLRVMNQPSSQAPAGSSLTSFSPRFFELMRSERNLIFLATLMIAIVLLSGCGSKSGPANELFADEWAGDSELERAMAEALGMPVDGMDEEFGPGDGTLPTLGSIGGSATPQETRRWGVFLKSFTGIGHQQAAQRMVESATAIDRKLGESRVVRTKSGSMVLYGAFEGPDESDAQKSLAWIKELTYSGRTVFPKAYLVRTSASAPGPISPFDVRAIRPKLVREYGFAPRDIYTLEVAVWGDFESGEYTWEQVRRAAERHSAKLRAEGYDSYFYHDADKENSAVTVGVFFADAIDPQSQLVMDPNLERMQRAFPRHLMNGEEVDTFVNARNPKLGTMPQVPTLVMVPE